VVWHSMQWVVYNNWPRVGGGSGAGCAWAHVTEAAATRARQQLSERAKTACVRLRVVLRCINSY
jgi:hypothetical protein